jgi:RNA polymerase sigma factor (sigma-70 family)
MRDFNRRLEREIPRLRRYARALTRNMVLADDLVQETLMRAVHKQHLWEPGTDLHAWLFMIMHNQYVNQVKHIMRDSAIIELNECAQSLVATTDPTASRQLRELERALGELPEEQREVILLVGLEGMSYDQAAAILNVPVGTIRSRLSRGREALRKLLGVEGRRPTTAAEHHLEPTQLAANQDLTRDQLIKGGCTMPCCITLRSRPDRRIVTGWYDGSNCRWSTDHKRKKLFDKKRDAKPVRRDLRNLCPRNAELINIEPANVGFGVREDDSRQFQAG